MIGKVGQPVQGPGLGNVSLRAGHTDWSSPCVCSRHPPDHHPSPGSVPVQDAKLAFDRGQLTETVFFDGVQKSSAIFRVHQAGPEFKRWRHFPSGITDHLHPTRTYVELAIAAVQLPKTVIRCALSKCIVLLP